MLPWVVSVARMVRRTILTNLLWAFGYNMLALTLAVLGLLQPVWAALIMAGSSLLVVLNSLRLERLPDPVPSAPQGRPPTVVHDGVRIIAAPTVSVIAGRTARTG